MTTHLRLFFRFLFFAGYTSLTVAEIWARNLLQGTDMARSMRLRRRWANRLLRGVGVNVRTVGDAPDFPCVVVSNHRSYLDPILVLRDLDAFPVAKAELARWPIIGKGAKMAGILYLKRESGGSRSAVLRSMLDAVQSGYPVLIFPEGTTSALEGTLPFKKGAFKLAAQAGIKVVPVAIVFDDLRDFWVGKDKFLRHAARRFREKKVEATLHYGPALEGTNPDALLAAAKGWIDEVLLRRCSNA